MNREQLKHLAVSATVTFPATYPRLAEIQLRQGANLSPTNGDEEATFLVAAERPSMRVTMKRVLPVSDVRAIFIPRDPNCVHPDDGAWFLGSEVELGVRSQIASRGYLYGIVYVAEQTATLLEVEAGMTAAESAQYYPPLPCDRSVNHYDPHRHAPAPMPEELGRAFTGQAAVDESFRGAPSACEHYSEFLGRQPFAGPFGVEPFQGEPSLCESHHEFPPPGAPYYKPDLQFSAPRAFGPEIEGPQQWSSQTFRSPEAFQPAPFPSEEAMR